LGRRRQHRDRVGPHAAGGRARRRRRLPRRPGDQIALLVAGAAGSRSAPRTRCGMLFAENQPGEHPRGAASRPWTLGRSPSSCSPRQGVP
jgi:hypothetical protein